MKHDIVTHDSNNLFTREILRAQASAVLSRMTCTLVTNAVIATGAFVISMIARGPTLAALYWLLALFTTLILRNGLASLQHRFDLAEREPRLSMRLAAAGALLTGATWASLPFVLNNFNAFGSDSGLCLMMLGMAASAVLGGAGNSIVPLSFALPPHVAVIASLAPLGLQGALLSLCVTGLTVLLYRAGRHSEATFVDNVRGKLQADDLARSLSRANREILDSNVQLERLANCDPLTGLPNRAAFNAALAQGIARCGDGSQMALIVIDLDGFKTVNDTLGHSVGDSLLVHVGERMRSVIDGADVLARLGGDEFAIVHCGPDAVERARRHCDAMLALSATPIMLADQSCRVGTSIGLAIYPDHAGSAEELFVCADMALYSAKDAGRGRGCEFHHDMRVMANRRRQIEQDLAGAIAEGAVEAWFQPQVTLDGHQIVGFEALVRWNHPQLGFVAPPEIVQAAFAMRLSDALTGLIADAACRLLTRLPALGLSQATVAINVSPREFALYSVADVIDGIARRHGIDPALLEIEITEEALLDTRIAADQLARIDRSGYKLAVDDFGAGHSSLTYLTGLKVDRLKIDRGITAGLTSTRQSQNIVAALVGLGKALSIEVLVEGVETAEDVAVLQSLGCSTAQGYHFARPMPTSRLFLWIAAKMQDTGAAAVKVA